MSVIDDVRQRLDIVEVAGSYVHLQKAGRNFKALCPFHSEKTPSFFIFPERQSWHCFGSCGTGGDVFSLVMRAERLEFGEALHLLAQKAGIDLAPATKDRAVEEAENRLCTINDAAAQFYHNLLVNSPVGAGALAYIEGRGLTKKIIEEFQLGCSPEGWETLKHHLLNQDHSEADLLAAGLIIQGERGTYDRFRQRLMFPIRDPRGRLVGFGARALDNSQPKYLNSPQTKLFDKSGILYGLHRASAAIRREDLAVIVEGYMDAIAAHQGGFENVVASMGTALSERQVSLLKRLSKRLALALDADAAGKTATLRDIDVAQEAYEKKAVPIPGWRGLVSYQYTLDADIRIITLPPERDPDEVIRESPEEWKRLVAEAQPVIEHRFQTIGAKYSLTNPKDKSAAVGELWPLIAAIPDKIQQAHYLQRLADLVKVNESVILASVKTPKPGKNRRAVKDEEPKPPTAIHLLQRDPLEEYCLSLLLRFPALREKASALMPAHFERSENRELHQLWRTCEDPLGLLQALEGSLREHYSSLQEAPLPPIDEAQSEAALAQCLARLEERRLRAIKAQEVEIVREEEAKGDPDKLTNTAFKLWQDGATEDWKAEDISSAVGKQLQGVNINSQLKEIFSQSNRTKHRSEDAKGE